MDRAQRLGTQAVIYRDWVAKHMGEPGFDLDDGFSTPEQDDDLFRMMQEDIPEE